MTSAKTLKGFDGNRISDNFILQCRPNNSAYRKVSHVGPGLKYHPSHESSSFRKATAFQF